MDINLKGQLEDPGLTGTEKFTDRLIVFVSDSVTVGNMEALSASGCLGIGIQRADCYCNSKARAFGRRMNSGSRFVAWLSETGVPDNTMLCRILGTTGNSCAPAGNFTWYDTNFQPIVSDMANLFNAAPAFSNAIRLTEAGATAPIGTDDVWTGTAQQGTALTLNCSNWQANTNAIQGAAGQSNMTNFDWTNKASGPCDLVKRIYCFAVP
ncbi:hypothetical protein [Turneriella parva]|nr:hypothetical protein [Turneriella parva]